jgi:hypothetical protein
MDFGSIESFQLANFEKLSRIVFNAMFTKMINLTELTIVYSVDYMTNDSMQLIFQHLVKLTVLILENTPNVRIHRRKKMNAKIKIVLFRLLKLDLVIKPRKLTCKAMVLIIYRIFEMHHFHNFRQ